MLVYMLNSENGIIAKYEGIDVYIEPDKKCEKIILPQSLFNYIIELEKINQEYLKIQMKMKGGYF